MMAAYDAVMFDVADSLRAALDDARSQLVNASSDVARANATGSGATDGAMARTAKAALFQEALLSTVHARLEEIKAVTK
jgi:hypothetical protein